MPKFKSFSDPEMYISWVRSHSGGGRMSDEALAAIWRYYTSMPELISCGNDVFDDQPDMTGCIPSSQNPLEDWEEFKSAYDAVLTYSIFPEEALRLTEQEYKATSAEELEQASLRYWAANTPILETAKGVVIHSPYINQPHTLCRQ